MLASRRATPRTVGGDPLRLLVVGAILIDEGLALLVPGGSLGRATPAAGSRRSGYLLELLTIGSEILLLLLGPGGTCGRATTRTLACRRILLGLLLAGTTTLGLRIVRVALHGFECLPESDALLLGVGVDSGECCVKCHCGAASTAFVLLVCVGSVAASTAFALVLCLCLFFCRAPDKLMI